MPPNHACSGRGYAARPAGAKIGPRLCVSRVCGRLRRAADANRWGKGAEASGGVVGLKEAGRAGRRRCQRKSKKASWPCTAWRARERVEPPGTGRPEARAAHCQGAGRPTQSERQGAGAWLRRWRQRCGVACAPRCR